jgi:hypothetical protein
MNNFTTFNPYTTQTPSGTLNKVVLTQPSHVAIQWPNPTGGTRQLPVSSIPSYLRKLFG